MNKILNSGLTLIAAALAVTASCSAMAGGNIEAGKAAVEQHGCQACHGKDLTSPIDPSYPKLAGQHQDYIAHALTAYQRGADGANGRGNAIMDGQAKTLSPKEIQDIAAYVHSLPGTLVLRPEPRFVGHTAPDNE